ncbi:MAG: hypothetical protein KDE32_02580, partial [Novosphingobium sp.]|nr:hypothetical protein [Novosphingobium sp.]
AVAHMSLHLNINNVKEPPNRRGGQPLFPDLASGGLGVRLCWRPKRTGKTGCTASVSGHIWRGFDSVNAFLQNNFADAEIDRNSAIYRMVNRMMA